MMQEQPPLLTPGIGDECLVITKGTGLGVYGQQRRWGNVRTIFYKISGSILGYEVEVTMSIGHTRRRVVGPERILRIKK